MKFLFSILFIAFCISGNAQVKTNFNNNKIIGHTGKFLKVYNGTDTNQINYQIPSKNISTLLKEEKDSLEKSTVIKPFKFAKAISVDLDIPKLIKWINITDTVFGKYTIKLNGAFSASINFDNFYLPKGTEMYIYNENGNMIMGPITENENNPNKVWGSWVHKGDVLIIEIKTPKQTLSELILHANNIAYGYKDIYGKYVGNFGLSAACEINVLCPLGNGWENERNAVSLMIDGTGQYSCSGAMVMNTCNTNHPFFLTANHCFVDFGNPALWRFTFQAWSPTCNPSQNADGVTYNGSNLRANWNGSDFCLVELNNPPPVNSGINYSGWSRANAAPPSGVSISHPRGDVMKLAIFNQLPAQQIYLGSNDWNVVWANGTVEPGSSGGPLYNNDHRIIGQVHGGNPNTICNANDNAFFGRFDVSWAGGGTDATRLSTWLDPSNSGALVTNTTNIANLLPANLSLNLIGNDYQCSGSATYTLQNNPLGVPITWTISDATIASFTTNVNQATISVIGSGYVILTAIVGQGCNYTNNTISKTIHVGAYSSSDFTLNCSSSINGYLPWCPNTSYSFGLTGPSATNYTWTPPTNWTPLYASGNAYVVRSPSTPTPPTGNIGVSFTEPCNTLLSKTMFVAYSANGCSSGSSPYTISPNPASSYINISCVAGQSYCNIAAVQITDLSGTVYYNQSWSYTNQQVQVPVSFLTPGTYIAKIYSGTQWYSMQFVKQ